MQSGTTAAHYGAAVPKLDLQVKVPVADSEQWSPSAGVTSGEFALGTLGSSPTSSPTRNRGRQGGDGAKAVAWGDVENYNKGASSALTKETKEAAARRKQMQRRQRAATTTTGKYAGGRLAPAYLGPTPDVWLPVGMIRNRLL